MAVLILALLLACNTACFGQLTQDPPPTGMDDPRERVATIASYNKGIREDSESNNDRLIEIGFDEGEDTPVSHAYESVNVKELPKRFFWGDVDGVNYLTETRNQNIPRKCFACWAFAVTSSLSDRINIMRKGKSPQVILSAQTLLNCNWGGGCQGGNPHKAFAKIKKHGIPDETCQPYVGREEKCDAVGLCKVCGQGNHKARCKAVKNFTQYYVSEYGWILGGLQKDAAGNSLDRRERIKAEVYQNGPIPCTIRATDKLRAYKGGIFSQFVLNLVPNHVVTVVGWGMEDGKEYWIARNSWGTYWGEDGLFRVRTGHPFFNLGIELFCAYGIPDIPDSDAKHSSSELEQIQVKGQQSYDIRNIGGVSYATLVRNQRVPENCNSGWAHSAMSALGDRIRLARKGKFPTIELSPQAVINCAARNKKAACNGRATPRDAFIAAMEKGAVDDTCSAYEGLKLKCRDKNICRTCNSRHCQAVDSGTYREFFVADHGKVSGSTDIMKEIAANGPVACGICADSAFEEYHSGILKSSLAEPCKNPNHYVAVSGFGTLDGVEFWVVRNSFGTYWGEQGWAKIARGQKVDYGIHRACHWAIPSPIHYESPYESQKRTSKQSTLSNEASFLDSGELKGLGGRFG